MKNPVLLALLPVLALPALIWGAEGANLSVDNFDGSSTIGTTWEIYFDKNNLGTKVNPFGFENGSAKSDKGKHGHFSGHLGRNMDPWPYAVAELTVDQNGPKDLSAYKAIRFHAKGDGKTYRVGLGRNAVTDHCQFQYSFTAPKEWTVIVCPLDKFAQPDWGKQIERSFKDVTTVRFEAPAEGDDVDFDLSFDDIEFVTTLPAVKKE